MTPNTDAPDAGAPDTANNDAAYPYSLRNRKNKKHNMTPNTDAPNNDSTDFAYDDASSPNSLILDSSLKYKIDPKSMLKLKNVKMTLTDADYANYDASPNAINTAPHAPNSTTTPDADDSTA